MTRRATSLPNGNSCIVFSDSFDGVTALALPAGWVATNAQEAAPLSVPSTTTPETAPNDALIDDPAAMSLPESSIGDGNFTDIAAGGSFVTGDYVATILPPGQPSPPPPSSPTPTPTPTPTPCSSNNGGLNPQPLTESGVAAPAGFFWSEVQHNTGNTTQANTNAGYNDTQGGGFRLADDFTISQTCTINNVVFYGYQTGAPATPSPFTAYTLQIWNGRPGDTGSAVVFGDTTTNRLASTTDSTYFRIFNTVVPPPGTPQTTTRKIWRNTVNVGGITLPPGTYWVDWASTVTAAANHFAPSKTIPGARGAAGDNARRFATGAWVDVTDAGTPAGGTPVPQDFPFEVNGTPSTVTPTPSPTVTVTPSATPTVTPSATPTPTPTLTPTPTPSPPPPVITSPLDVTGTVGLPFAYQFEATGATSLAVSNLPPGLGLVFNSTLRVIVGTPITSGAFPVVLSATNSGGTTNQTLNITVQSLPTSGPVIISSTCATGRTGRPFRFQLQTSGGSSATHYTVGGLPPGLNVDPPTGFISGTPTSDGSFGLAVSAIDGAAVTQATLQLTFTSDPTVPIITSPGTAILTTGQFFSYTMTADANGTFGYIGTDGIAHQGASSAGLPAGLGFDGIDTISGTFTGGPIGGLKTEAADRHANGGPRRISGVSGGIVTNVLIFATDPSGTGTFPLITFIAARGTVQISTRMAVGTGDNALIGGFIISGTGTTKALIRAIGPSLSLPPFNISGTLQDPALELRDQAGSLLGSNDNWRDSQRIPIEDTDIPPNNNLESAILAFLSPGPYTAIVRGNNNTTGVALVEVYDLGIATPLPPDNARLANISTRGFVATGDNVIIGGFIIRPESPATSTRVILRAIGPSLTQFGIPNALANPTLELRDGNAALLDANNDWQDNPAHAAELTAENLAPTNQLESGIAATLPLGPCTAIVRGIDNGTGVALVEVYALE